MECPTDWTSMCNVTQLTQCLPLQAENYKLIGNVETCLFLQSLELWNMTENKTMTLPAHEGLIAALAVSNATGYVASASHDKLVKLWK